MRIVKATKKPSAMRKTANPRSYPHKGNAAGMTTEQYVITYCTLNKMLGFAVCRYIIGDKEIVT